MCVLNQHLFYATFEMDILKVKATDTYVYNNLCFISFNENSVCGEVFFMFLSFFFTYIK